MTISTSCSHTGGRYQWSAMDLAIDDRHIGFGHTKEEALADLTRLLNERAEHAEQVAEQDAQNGKQDTQASRPAPEPQPIRVTLIEQLETLIDRYGVANILTAVTEICDHKAEHIAVNWQDAHLAKRWTHVATAASMAAAKGVGL